MTHAPRRRPATAVFLTLIVIALSVFSPAAPAATAHDQVQSTVPADGERLDVAPSTVTIRFTDEILEIGAIVLVVDSEDRNWAEGEMRLDGPEATQALAAGMKDGAYQVRWRVVSADGHPVSGAFAFSIGTAAPSEPDAGATAAPNPSTGPGAASDADADQSDAAGLPLIAVGLIGAGGGLAAFALFAAWRAKRRKNT
ncbi:copper resistance protein CopC [Cryobacterium sp. TMT1-21]|uniref:copper resistance CopC family protein n=1 Tax=Cryobacterium sp. TMT1-21 TaxID=1259234 RepID=UPI00106C8731|nr:copper resistance CopC family protein [Cryobacterium sp. TMT1-21]TFD08623.1 copper resistance protein CopC [Cryobacterium sp. TMT1-21]